MYSHAFISRLKTGVFPHGFYKYSVPSDSVDPVTGKTALEVTKRLYEKYNGEEMQWHGPGLSCFRILKMIQLKEKQRVSN